MKITIKSFTNVLIDGKPSGGIVDALANGGDVARAPMLDALKKYADEIGAMEKDLLDQLAQEKANSAAREDGFAEIVFRVKDALQSSKDDAEKLALLSVIAVEVATPSIEKKRKELEIEKARIEDELAGLPELKIDKV